MATGLLAVLSALLLFGVAAVFYQLVKQQGRFLLRMDDVERRLGKPDQPVMPTEQAQAKGLEMGTLIESFSLPDLSGKQRTLEEFRGKRVLLVNWNPGCGFCVRIAAELARLEGDLQTSGVQLLLLAHGAMEANRKLAEEYGLDCPILLQNSQDVMFFNGSGTPVAYLLDEENRVAEPLAIGAEQVPSLAKRAVTSKANSSHASVYPRNRVSNLLF